MMDGNAEQIRVISNQLAEAWAKHMPSLAEIDKRIEEKVLTANLQLKLWLLGAAIVNLIPLALGAFYLGGIYQTNAAALKIVQEQQGVLAERQQWMFQRERWEQAVEAWATPRGLELPTDRQAPQ